VAAGKEALSRGRAVLIVLVLASASRLTYLYALYLAGLDGVQRHHVETTATVFVALGLLSAFLLHTRGSADADAVTTSPAPVSAPVSLMFFCSLAGVLYAPALFIGPLSDDYVLMLRAASWDVSAVSSTLFRPIPLLAWSAVLAAGAGPIVLHALNIVLHGVNAWLSSRVISGWVAPAWAGTAGGLLVLTAPLAPEAVAWASGIFDVSATALVLTSVLIARRYTDNGTPAATRAAFVATSLAAVLCKETAAIGPLLVLLTARPGWRAAGALRSTLVRDTAIVLAAIAVFAAARFVIAPEPSLFRFSKYAVQRTLFAAFGGLAAPFHDDITNTMLWLPLSGVVLVICLLVWFFVTPGPRRDLGAAVRGAMWIVIAIAPAWAILVIPGNLEASRFLYLAGTGWALTLVAAAAGVSRVRSPFAVVPRVALLVLVLIAGAATREHLRHWQEAREARDALLRAVASDARLRACPDVAILNPPDTVRGAYVFRNGLHEALAGAGIVLVERPKLPSCRFEWREESGILVQR
jgi:hypothetical protein